MVEFFRRGVVFFSCNRYGGINKIELFHEKITLTNEKTIINSL